MVKNSKIIFLLMTSLPLLGDNKVSSDKALISDISSSYEGLRNFSASGLVKEVKKSPISRSKKYPFVEYVKYLSGDISDLRSIVTKPFQDREILNSALALKSDLEDIKSKIQSTKEFKQQNKRSTVANMAGKVVKGAVGGCVIFSVIVVSVIFGGYGVLILVAG
jgi:hypothetical protein